MKLELVETTNHVKYGNYFEVRKEGTCIETFFYGYAKPDSREVALGKATEMFNRIKTGNTEQETIILSGEI